MTPVARYKKIDRKKEIEFGKVILKISKIHVILELIPPKMSLVMQKPISGGRNFSPNVKFFPFLQEIYKIAKGIGEFEIRYFIR